MHRKSGKLFIRMLTILTILIGGDKQDSNFFIKTFETALLNKVKIKYILKDCSSVLFFCFNQFLQDLKWDDL